MTPEDINIVNRVWSGPAPQHHLWRATITEQLLNNEILEQRHTDPIKMPYRTYTYPSKKLDLILLVFESVLSIKINFKKNRLDIRFKRVPLTYSEPRTQVVRDLPQVIYIIFC